MPFGDGTGPIWAGPRLGRGLGRCMLRWSSPLGMRNGFGFGWGAGRYLGGVPTDRLSTSEERDILKMRADYLKKQLKAIEDTLADSERTDER